MGFWQIVRSLFSVVFRPRHSSKLVSHFGSGRMVAENVRCFQSFSGHGIAQSLCFTLVLRAWFIENVRCSYSFATNG